MSGAFENFVKSCNYVSLKSRIHVDGSSCSCLRLRFSKMLFSEQELAVEIADFNDIWVSQHNLSSWFWLITFDLFTSAYSKHRVVF